MLHILRKPYVQNPMGMMIVESVVIRSFYASHHADKAYMKGKNEDSLYTADQS